MRKYSASSAPPIPPRSIMRFSFRQFPAWVSWVCMCLFTLLVLLAGQAGAEVNHLNTCLAQAQTPLAHMECFKGLPYRADGALDEHGRWTTWADQSQSFASAGLNCSGLTMAISRSILGQTLSLNAAQHDRLGDSGPGSPMGQDWDFGLDLILNLTDGLPRRLIPDPYENQDIDPRMWSAADLRGTDVDSPAFATILAQLQPDKVYYFAISKLDARFKGGISFYHVGLIIKEGASIWMYHATAKGGVYRTNLAGESGLAWFRRYYGASPRGPRYIQLVEVM